MKWADSQAVRVVVNTERMRQKLLQQGYSDSKVVRIPNLFDVEQFDKHALQPFSWAEQLPDGPRVVMVARLDAEKDFTTLIRAMKLVLEKSISAKLIVAGAGVQRSLLECLVEELALKESVVFLGEVQEVPALLQHCHVGVLTPKANEGLSNSILEYMAAGLPVVATDCGGNAELIEHGISGLIVPVGDSGAVADALLRLLEHPCEAQQMGARGRCRVEQDYHPDVVTERFAVLYREALA